MSARRAHDGEAAERTKPRLMRSTVIMPRSERDIILVEVPVPVTEALRPLHNVTLSFVNGPLRSGFGNRYRYR